MHEVRAAIPSGHVAEAIRLAHAAGIDEATTCDVFIHGPDVERVLLSVETSTPKARAFIDALMKSGFFTKDFTLTSREIRAIVSKTPVESLTRPMSEPFPDLIQDLWQLSHVTWSYLARALAGGMILATGIIENNVIAIVAAALFLPFLAQAIAIAVGIWRRDPKLFAHGLKAVGVSIASAFVGGVVVGLIEGGPIAFQGFKSPLSSFGISAVIGITAGLSNMDDSGRRYLIGVAAAVQLALFPVWFGLVIVIGMPSHEILSQRAFSFLINLGTIVAGSAAAYALTQRNKAGAFE